MMLTWLADVLRAGGLTVTETPGWKTRGHGPMLQPRGVLLHHTAGAATGNYPSLSIVRDGRPGLPGPLAQLGLARDGTWLVIAAGQAWHAGAGGPLAGVPKDQGNQYLIGVEAESVGVREDWTPAQRAAYPRGVAVLLRHLGLGADRAVGHKEWAPARKIDPAFWSMTVFRAAVAEHLARRPDPPPSTGMIDDQEDEMFLAMGAPPAGRIGLLSGGLFRELLPTEKVTAQDTIHRQGADMLYVEQATWDWWTVATERRLS